MNFFVEWVLPGLTTGAAVALSFRLGWNMRGHNDRKRLVQDLGDPPIGTVTVHILPPDVVDGNLVGKTAVRIKTDPIMEPFGPMLPITLAHTAICRLGDEYEGDEGGDEPPVHPGGYL